MGAAGFLGFALRLICGFLTCVTFLALSVEAGFFSFMPLNLALSP